MPSVSYWDNKIINKCLFRVRSNWNVLLQSLQWNKMSKLKVYRGLGFQEWTVCFARPTKGSQKNTIGSKQTTLGGWQSMRFSVSQEQIQNECERPPGCHFPPLLSHHKGASSHRDWLGGERPQAASTPQSGVGLARPAHRWSESPAISPEGFLKISPKPRMTARRCE